MADENANVVRAICYRRCRADRHSVLCYLIVGDILQIDGTNRRGTAHVSRPVHTDVAWTSHVPSSLRRNSSHRALSTVQVTEAQEWSTI